MKAVLVASSGEDKKLYYVLDARSKDTDGVLSIDGKSSVVDFWDTAMSLLNLVPLLTTEFHKYLWEGFSDEEESERWERIFVKKTQQIDEEMVRGLTFSKDVMKTKKKSLLVDQRAFDFKTLLQTQNASSIRGISGK